MSRPSPANSTSDETHSSRGRFSGTDLGGRVSRVDAFRGLGCLAVLLAHCAVMVPWVASDQVNVIIFAAMIFNGHMAVMIFFVVSGYVLGLSLDRGAGQPGNYSRFYFRRVFRIYPAHLVTLVFITIALSLFDHTVPPPGSSEIYAFLFPAHVSPVDWLLNALLLRPEMNGIVWTLALELAVSIVFPLLYLASRHSSWRVRAGVLVGLIGMSVAVGNRITEAGVPMGLGGDDPVMLAILRDLWNVPVILNNLATYGYVFYIGLVAEPVFKRLVPKIDGRLGTSLMVFAWFITLFHGDQPPQPVPLFLEVCGATILVFLGALMQTRNPLVRALDHPFFNHLGKISYSFYLFHLIIVYCIATVMFRLLGPTLVGAYPLPFVLVLMVLAFVATSAVATVSYRLIELPMIAYSKGRTRSWVAPTLRPEVATAPR